MPAHPLDHLVRLSGVTDAVAEARQACEELRWHRALRKQWPVARAEAGVRCAHAGLALDGVRVPRSLVRDVARGAAEPPAGPEGDAVVAALRVQSEVERLMAAPGAVMAARPLPLGQLLVRLHVAAAAADGGRLRQSGAPADLRGLGPAPVGPELAARLAALSDLVAAPLTPQVPALVVAAVVHAELLVLRPFQRENAAVARAVLRHQLTAGGVDPVGVVVVEVAWSREPALYLSRAAGFATGGAVGMAGWLVSVAAAVTAGAVEGRSVADAVLAGRLEGGAARPS